MASASRSSGVLGLLALLSALGFGAALLLDLGGLQGKLFTEGPLEPKPLPAAALLPPPATPTPAPAGPVTPAWYLDASGFDGAELERQSARATMVVYFQKKRCDACRKFEKDLLAAPEVKAFLSEVVKVRVDPEAGEREQRLARRYEVKDLPALLVVPQRGPVRLVPVRAGSLDPHALVAYCR